MRVIINGSQGMKRIDLIVARYEKNQDNGIESLDLKVIQGTPAESTPKVPEYTEGDIQAGDYVADMPMYQVIIACYFCVKKSTDNLPRNTTGRKLHRHCISKNQRTRKEWRKQFYGMDGIFG